MSKIYGDMKYDDVITTGGVYDTPMVDLDLRVSGDLPHIRVKVISHSFLNILIYLEYLHLEKEVDYSTRPYHDQAV